MIEPKRASGAAHHARVHEHETHREPPNEAAPRRLEQSELFGFGAGGFEQMRIIDAGGAGRGACEAAKAVAHFLGEIAAEGQFFVCDRTHECDAPAWGMALATGFGEGRAGLQAHAAMHALLEDRVV